MLRKRSTIIDAQAGNINPVTIRQLRAKGPVRHLLGLPAKIYIIDDDVMLASANLTRTAFACRHDIGIHLTGRPAQEAIMRHELKAAKGSEDKNIETL